MNERRLEAGSVMSLQSLGDPGHGSGAADAQYRRSVGGGLRACRDRGRAHPRLPPQFSLANRINAELGLAIVGTRSTGETTARVAALLKTSGRSRALTIVRTELGRAYSLAGQQRMEQASEVLPGLRKQWRRSGKLRARLTHDAIDGQLRHADKPFSVGGASLLFPRDPAGPAAETVNCGCQSLPWMESWEVKHPRRKAFSEEEIARNPIRAEL